MSSEMNIVIELPAIYGMDKNGKTKIWKASIYEKDGMAVSNIQHGQLSGKLQTTFREYTTGKNIGRKNETTPLEQCIQETKRKRQDKLEKEGYRETMGEAHTGVGGIPSTASEVCEGDVASVAAPTTTTTILPMLAHVYEPNKNKKNQIVFPCCVQPKLDGLRCVAYLAANNAKPIYQSRTGAHFSTMDHLDASVADFIRKIRGKLGGDQAIYLDGELYTDKIPFETLAGLIKKKKITEEDREKLAIVEYNIYDVYIPSSPDLTFIARWELLKTLYDGIGDQVADFTLTPSENPPPYRGICLVATEMAGLNDFRRKFCEYVEQGYEGVMLRNLSGVYRTNYRSHDLQKYKEFFEDEFEIVGFSEGEGRERGTVIWKCITKEGREFSVRPKGTVEYRKELFENAKKYVGKMATIIYQELSEYGVPRFPVGKAVRDGY